jgi:hypothetical protein
MDSVVNSCPIATKVTGAWRAVGVVGILIPPLLPRSGLTKPFAGIVALGKDLSHQETGDDKQETLILV